MLHDPGIILRPRALFVLPLPAQTVGAAQTTRASVVRLPELESE